MYVCMYVYVYIYICVCTYVCMYVFIYVCVCMYVAIKKQLDEVYSVHVFSVQKAPLKVCTYIRRRSDHL